ncbi:MAG TPA: YgjP-like metallopeptidase domain-containing protein, partial [Bacteroidales bacterium]|nr:YgjP-like metallopeptidase domain-containing protein [Bacteroidales bacterium]
MVKLIYKLQAEGRDDIPMEVIRKPIKNIYIRIYPPDGRVVVSAPLKMPARAVNSFIKSKKYWIEKQHSLLSKTGERSLKSYSDGEIHYYSGKKYALRVINNKTGTNVNLNEDEIIISSSSSCTAEKTKALLEGWYRERLKEKVRLLVSKWEKQMGVVVSEARIKRMKTRWGTCNIARKRIWLNLELVKYD